MVKTYTPSGEERPLANYLEKEMRNRGFSAEIDGAGNVVGRKGSGSRTILLAGHMDTVPGEIKVETKQGALYGRGSVDAKGSLATFIHAADNWEVAEGWTLYVIGLVEEESSSRGAHFIAERYQPDFVVIGEPSDWQGITVGYRGSINVRYVREQPLTHRGTSETLPVEGAVEFYNRVKKNYEAGGDGGFHGVSVRILELHTGEDPFKDSVNMKLQLRIPVGFEASEVAEHLQELAGSANLTILDKVNAIRSEKNNSLVRSFLSSIRDHGGKPKFKVKTGTSDMNVLGNRWEVPIIAYGPGDSDLDHTPNEHLQLEEFEKACEVLTTALKELTKQ